MFSVLIKKKPFTELQQIVMGLKREHRESLDALQKDQDVSLFNMRGEQAEKLCAYEEQIRNLELQVENLKKASFLRVFNVSFFSLSFSFKSNSSFRLPVAGQSRGRAERQGSGFKCDLHADGAAARGSGRHPGDAAPGAQDAGGRHPNDSHDRWSRSTPTDPTRRGVVTPATAPPE